MHRSSAGWLVALVASLAHAVAYCVALPEHFVDGSWPDHARFHALQSLIWVVGLDLGAAAVAWRGFRERDRFGRWLLGGLGAAGQAAYFIGLVAVPAGHPPEGWGAHAPLLAIAALFALGWGLTWRAP